MKIIVFFSSRWSFSTSSCMSRRISGSSALNGSSNSMISGSVAKRPREPHPLLHAARELVGVRVPPAAQPHRVEDLVRLRVPLVLVDPLHLEAERDVLHDAAVREQAEVLEHHADLLPADLTEALIVELHDVLAVDQHLAGGRVVQPVDHADERGLARAGQPHHHEDLALRDVERDVADGRHAARSSPGAPAGRAIASGEPTMRSACGPYTFHTLRHETVASVTGSTPLPPRRTSGGHSGASAGARAR